MKIRMRSMLNRFFVISFMLIIFVLLFTACGVDKSETKIDTVKLIMSASVNWDEDVLADGVQFLLIPTDTDGWPVREELMVSASLWSLPNRYKIERGDLIQEWKDIRITKRTYERYGEARVRLEYEDYVPGPNDYGILDVTVHAKDGMVFPFEQVVSLGYFSGSQDASGCCY